MTITVYTKPGCFPCRKTVEKFQEAGLAPHLVDVTTNDEALEYITEELKCFQVPVIVYEKEGSEDYWSGLNLDKINRVIELEKAH